MAYIIDSVKYSYKAANIIDDICCLVESSPSTFYPIQNYVSRISI